MAETRKLAAILVSDVVGYSRLAGADEDRILARLRALRSDLIDPIIAVHNGRVVKRTGDGAIVELRSVVDAVRCAIEVQNGMVERNAGLPPERRIQFRIGIHLGDVVEESDGDLMGDGVNIAARLQGIAKPGAICLSEDAYRQVKSRLDLAVSDLGPTQLKNIAEPVRVYALEVGKPAQAKPVEPVKPVMPKKRSTLAPIVAGIVALIVIAALGAWYLRAGQKQAVIANAPAHLSIVVLPFRNLSGDPSQDYFADGMTENLTTDLSRIRNSFVIARNTAFTFKGKNIDTKEISKELGVRYVLEGSVQRDQNHVRVNAQLIDGETGAHLWADRFEESITDLFKLQDQVVARLANTLGYELVKAEAQRGTHSTNPDAIDLTMRGWAALWQPPSNESTLACAALVVEGDDPLGRARQVGDDEADARIKLARMPLDLGDHPARLGPASRLVGEIGIEPTHLVRRSPDRALEQIADPALQDLVGGQPDRVFDPLRLQELVDFWHCKGRVRPEIDARDLALIAHNDRLEHTIPAIGAVHVAGTQRAAFQITELVEHEQRVIAGAGVMAVPDAVSPARRGSGSRSNPCRARCLSAGGGHARGRSTGRTSRKEQRGSQVPRATASRTGPSGSAKPHGPEPLCRRQSSASLDRGADARRRSRPHSQRDDQTPTAAANRPAHGGRFSRCAHRRASRPPSRSARVRRRVRGTPIIPHRT